MSKKKLGVIGGCALIALISAYYLYTAFAPVVRYNQDMTWADGVLDIGLENRTGSILQVSIMAPYLTTVSVQVGAKEHLGVFPMKNLFIEKVTNVFVVCDGHGNEKLYPATVTVENPND
jgi:hypothetical protein